MRVALVHFLSPLKNANHKGILQKLENAVIKKGYQIDIFNAHTDSSTMRLTGYDYISIIVPSSPLFGAKLPEKFDEVLENCGMLKGITFLSIIPILNLFQNKVFREAYSR